VRAGLSYLGVAIDATRNSPQTADALISPSQAKVAVARLHVREDWIMAISRR
jgi:acetate kinase